jgi:hypothetical protein
MIITRLLGGLGNQMFQYAAGLALAEKHRTVLKLDVGWFRHYPEYEDHNRYSLNCFNVTEQFATAQEVEYLRGKRLTTVEKWSERLATKLKLYHYADGLRKHGNHYSTDNMNFDPEFWRQPDNTYLEGMWQSEKFFLSIANLLRLHFSFRYPPQPRVAKYAQQIMSGPSAVVHFRRGDYVRNANFNSEIGVLPLDYYYHALEMIYAQCPEVMLYIFSDDIEAIRKEFRPPGKHVFVDVVEHWHAYDKIRLMSMCDHAIISNSTFAWWSAWLNPSPTKMIVAPDPWFAGRKYSGTDLIPEAWRRVPVRNAKDVVRADS